MCTCTPPAALKPKSAKSHGLWWTRPGIYLRSNARWDVKDCGDRKERRRGMRINRVAALALMSGVSFLKTATAADLPKTLDCVYLSQADRTTDNSVRITASYGIWGVDASALIRSPSTPYSLSIPIISNNADQLVASSDEADGKGFVVVIIDKSLMLLHETDVGGDGSVKVDRIGDCRDHEFTSPHVF